MIIDDSLIYATAGTFILSTSAVFLSADDLEYICVMAYITITTPIDDVYFSSSFPEIEIMCPVVFYLEVIDVMDNTVYLSERYDGARQVFTSVSGLSEVFFAIVSAFEFKSIRLVLRIRTDLPSLSAQEVVDIPVLIYYCSAHINIAAKEFLSTRFLTTHFPQKKLNINSEEFLYWEKSGITSEPLRIVATYSDSDYRLSTAEFIEESHPSSFYQEFMLTPKKYVSANEDLHIIQLAVWAGSRVRRFLLEYAPVRTSFAFENIFGLIERIDLYGETETVVETTREEGIYNKLTKSSIADFERVFSVKTGVLLPPTADWLEEMVYSPNIYIIKNKEMLPISLRESVIERSSSLAALEEFEFKYVLSARDKQYRISVPIRTGIFDDTFNDTFE